MNRQSASQEKGKGQRCHDPFMDRRSGEDRRKLHSLDYFNRNNPDRRSNPERRSGGERRSGCIRVSEWSSVCPDQMEHIMRGGRIQL